MAWGKAVATTDFNLWWVLMSLFLNQVYGTMAWQNNHAFNASGKTPHETRMGNFLTNWITGGQLMMITLLALFTFTFLHNPAPAIAAAPVKDALAQFTDPTAREQARLPLSLAYLLPHGIKGLPKYVSGAGFNVETRTGNFSQSPDSPGKGKALVIPNFCEPVDGQAPDMGAVQGTTPFVVGVKAEFIPAGPKPAK